MSSLRRLPFRLAKRGDRRFRELTAPWRLLPELLLIGAQKSGTTSLYNYLIEHPQVLPGTVKEVRYFNANYSRGESWYRAHFPLAVPEWLRRSSSEPITLDASTGYLPSPEAPQRVLTDLPNAKFVVLLRDPVERAWSHYRHTVRDGNEPLTFAEAIASEESRLEGVASSDSLSGERVTSNRTFSFHTYLLRGRYHEQLERWFALFDRSRFLIMRAEEFFADPRQTTDQVLEFIGVKPVSHGDFAIHNAGVSSDLPSKDRRALEAYFAPHNAKLFELLGWQNPWPSQTEKFD